MMFRLLKPDRFSAPALFRLSHGGRLLRIQGLLALCCAALCVVAFICPARAQNAALRNARRPNLDIHTYRRANTPDEKVVLNLTAYNLHAVTFTLYRLRLPSLIPTSKALEDFAKRIREVDVRRLRAVRAWKLGLGEVYPDQWMEHQVTLPHLAPGVYLVRAQGGGAEKRTWLAITDIALLAKRSRHALLIYAARAHSGQPVSDLPLTITDAAGRSATQTTDRQGLCRLPLKAEQANAWIYGEKQGSPAFVLAGAPAAPEPYTTYVVTDRPIYRPSHKVQYKGTIRERVEAEAPGGFRYQPYAHREATVEIRDATDALLAQRKVTTNANGSFDGTFQLAAEPTLGNWQIVTVIGNRRTYTAFAVEAYRKPEFVVGVQFDQAHASGGATLNATIDARYYFGQPVTNAPVQYSIVFQPENYGALDGATPEPPFNGQGITDAQGRLKLEIKTQRLPFNRRLMVQASVTDLSRRTQQAAGSARVTAGLFQLSMETDKYVYRVGDTLHVIVHAEDYDSQPVAGPVRVEMTEVKYDRQNREYKEKTARDIHTDARGQGVATFALPRPGISLQLTAQATDRDRNVIRAAGAVWVAGDDVETYDYPTLLLMPDRTSYRPGDVATLLINTSLVAAKSAKSAKPVRPRAAVRPRRRHAPDDQEEARPVYRKAWALVTVEGERLYSQQLIALTSRSTSVQLPLTAAHFPSVEVSVTILQEKQVYQQQARLQVMRDEQKLMVSVTPDKEKYQAGETASYTIRTRNAAGAPMPAEVGFGVVDASIYAIQRDNAPDLEQFFYSGQEVRVQTDFSFAAQYSGGAFQTIAASAPGAMGGAAPPQIRVRRQFADTAYWNPYVLTDADGTARVSFTMPDNLTTWRATARGVSLQTAVGSATRDVIATMPLLVRLTLPRFYVQEDQAVVSAIVHNDTGSARDVAVHIETAGADLNGDAARTLHIEAGGQERIDWSARIHPEHNETGSTVRFLVTADGGEGARDATEVTLPVQADGVKMVEAHADMVEGNVSRRFDLTTQPPGATLTLTLAPSLAASMLEALDYLTSYPYGCAEQTMSSFLPDVIVAGALRRLGTDHKVHPDLAQWVNLGLQKLYRYQHADGGWNWWEFDQTDGDMTAYVLWGLIQARDAGYLVDEQRIRRGTESLLNQLQQQPELSRRADWLLTLSYAAPERIAAPLNDLYANRDKLDTYALASLCLALVRENSAPLPPPPPRKPGEAPQAIAPPPGPAAIRQLVTELEAKVAQQGTTAYWPAAEGGYSWRSDDADVTAHVLRALLAADPRSPLLPPAVIWLMGNREGKAWSSTRASAEAVFALAQYLEQTHELHPAFQTTIRLDGQILKRFAPTASQVFDAPLTITLTPAELRGHRELTIENSGTGRLYSTRTVTYTIPSAEAKAVHKGIGIRRTYRVEAEDPSQASSVTSGQDMEVQVEVTADADYRYAMIEEPIPAGCEVQPGDEQYRPRGLSYEGNPFQNNGGGYVRQEVRDNRVVFFFDALPKGRTRLVYHLHAETPGLYRILPGIGSLVYFPEIRGNSLPVHAKVIDK